MASTINASTAGAGGLISTADASGVLQLQTAGTTAITVNSTQQTALGDTTSSAVNSDRLFVAGTGSLGNITQVRNGITTNGCALKHYKTRGTSSTNQVALINGDVISVNYAYGSDGTAYVAAGTTQFYVNGAVSTNIVPTGWAVNVMNAAGSIPSQLGVDSNGYFSFNSNYGSAAVAYGCRAWVNFNGTGTVAIRASGNVSSITDNGVGNYTVNFTTAMPDVNYSALAVDGGSGNNTNCMTFTYTTGSFNVSTQTATSAGYQDSAQISCAVFR